MPTGINGLFAYARSIVLLWGLVFVFSERGIWYNNTASSERWNISLNILISPQSEHHYQEPLDYLPGLSLLTLSIYFILWPSVIILYTLYSYVVNKYPIFDVTRSWILLIPQSISIIRLEKPSWHSFCCIDFDLYLKPFIIGPMVRGHRPY